MKVTVKQVVEAYKAFGEAKVTKLEDGEVVKIVKARKAMRPVAEDYEAFLKDAQEKFKPDGWDEVQKKVQQWQREGEKTTLTEAERMELNKALIGYTNKVNEAVKEELSREVELTIEKLKDDTATKLLTENGWEVKKLDELEAVL